MGKQAISVITATDPENQCAWAPARLAFVEREAGSARIRSGRRSEYFGREFAVENRGAGEAGVGPASRRVDFERDELEEPTPRVRTHAKGQPAVCCNPRQGSTHAKGQPAVCCCLLLFHAPGSIGA